MPQDFGLHRLATPELKRLLRALHRDVFTSPITRSSLIEKAFGHIEADLDLIVGRDVASAKAVVIAVLGERESTRGPVASLSFCGAPAPGTRSRDLLEQVRELLASATKSVHVYGLTIGEDRGLLRTLTSLMNGRDVQVRLVFDGAHDDDGAARAKRFLVESLGKSEHAQLTAYVCKRTLRARVVVVDDAKTLVTSGDLAGTEEDGYVDVGVLFSDSGYTRALNDEWTRMLASDTVVAI